MSTTRFTQRINGFVYGYSDISIDIDGTIFEEISDINYDVSIERGELRGTSPVPQGFTNGYATYKGNMTLSKDQASQLMKALGNGFAGVPFTVTITYGPTLDNLTTTKTQTDVLNGCLLSSIGNAHSGGGNALMTKFDLTIQDIEFDGQLRAFASS